MEDFKVRQIVLFKSYKMNFQILHLFPTLAIPLEEQELHSPIKALTVMASLFHGFGILAMERQA